MISDALLSKYKESIDFDLLAQLDKKGSKKLDFDYFEFYNAKSSVYSSKIEGEEIDVDSYYKHKFLGVEYLPDYTKRSDDLYSAYEFILENALTWENVKTAHNILSSNILPSHQQGTLRNNPMYVLNNDGQIEYVACSPLNIKDEIDNIFELVDELLGSELSIEEVFYYASFLHLHFVNIHPFQDGNGRTSRLLEKWFLKTKLGDKAISVDLEKHYYDNRTSYYYNLKIVGLEYDHLDYTKALPFLLMTVSSLQPNN